MSDAYYAWDKYRKTPQLDKGGWGMVAGPLGAIIKMPQIIGWDPVTMNRWEGRIDKENRRSVHHFHHKNLTAIHLIRKAVVDDIRRTVWEEASSRSHGDGLQYGEPDLRPAKSVHSKLLRAGEYKEARGLEAAADHLSLEGIATGRC